MHRFLLPTALRRFILFGLLLAVSVCIGTNPAWAQNSSSTQGSVYGGTYEDLSHRWVSNIGEQLRASLYSRSDEVRFRAIQDVVTLATLYPGQLDLTPTVRPLLQIYATSENQSHRMATINALYAVGDSRGMGELSVLSSTDIRSSQLRHAAQPAVALHFTTQKMRYHEAKAQRYRAEGTVKKAARHTRRADKYRSQIGYPLRFVQTVTIRRLF